MGKNFIDLTGQRFGRLTILRLAEKGKKGRRCWLCKCDCGNSKVAQESCLKSGRTRSCGCLVKEKARSRKHQTKGPITHGHSKGGRETPTYKSWKNMWTRWTNRKRRSWDCYGGRGIKVCTEWRDFAVFLKDLGERPEGTTLDRIDSDGNYEPGNCRWASPSIQARNKKNKRGGRSRYKGARWYERDKKWECFAYVGEKLTYVGLYPTEDTAAMMYNIVTYCCSDAYCHLNNFSHLIP